MLSPVEVLDTLRVHQRKLLHLLFKQEMQKILVAHHTGLALKLHQITHGFNCLVLEDSTAMQIKKPTRFLSGPFAVLQFKKL